MTIGKMIKKKRTALDLSQRELAHRSGVSVQTINYIESEKRNPSALIVQKLAKALHCTVGELFGEKAS